MPCTSSPTSSPVVARFHHLLGLAMEWCGWQAGAEHAFRDALRVNPSFPSAHYRLGETLGRQGRWREASHEFQEAVRFDPSSAELQGNLVLALARAGQWAAVADALRRLADLRPREGEIFMLLGAVLKRLQRHHEAIRAFRWAVRLEAAPAGRHFFLGEELLGPRGWHAVLSSWGQAKGLGAPLDAAPPVEGHSPLHRHPGPPLETAGGRRRTAPRTALGRLATRLDTWSDRLRPPEVPFSEVLAREEEERSILRVYREPRPFPVDDGGRPVRVHRGAAAVLERRRRGHA